MEEQDEVEGAGGKLTKRSLRSSKVTSTPYSRPSASRASAATGGNMKSGWFSKILETPASKILPSLFSFSSLSSKHQDQDGDGDCSLPVIQQEHAPASTFTSNNQYSEPKELGTSGNIAQQKVDFKNDELAPYASTNLGIAEIVQQMQQKKFSKDEANRLIELLRSRTTDLPDSDSERAAGSKLEALNVSQGQEDFGKSMREDYGVQFDSRTTRKPAEHIQITANDVTSSPVEIAKAYMDSRTSGTGYDFRTGRLKIEKNSFYTDNSSSKLSFKPGAKSLICWPGVVLENDNGYYTPRRGSVPYHPRTPYSGSLFSKSTSKMTPRTKSVRDDGVASVSSIHHTNEKNFAFKAAGPSSSIERKLEDGSSKSSFYKFQSAEVVDDEVPRFGADSTPVHPQSSLMARKILENLDRSVPSPKEKLQEIKLARMRVPPKPDTLVMDGLCDKHEAKTPDEPKSILRQSTATFNNKDQDQPQISKQSVFGLASDTIASPARFQIAENQAKPASFQTLIPTTKPSEKLRTPNNGFFSFTFPTPATSAAFSEPPPTPTMASSLAKSRVLEAGEESTLVFNFGPKSGERLNFSFGSTVSASDIDVSTPTFKFGNENNSRISCKRIGRDAVCH